MNNKQLQQIKGDLYEIIQDNYCGTTKSFYLGNVDRIFDYITELEKTNKLLRTKISQLRKEIE